MKNFVRLDVWTAESLCDFMDWARTKNPKTKEDMKRLLAEYKKADLMVEGHKEHVEHMIVEGAKRGAFKRLKGDQK